MTTQVRYNERSWAIDVISEINLFLANKSFHFKSAGGENTISNKKNNNLFPDVLLFKDSTKSIIVQGWELKMPDTRINDNKLISNAIKKAKILKRNSFILWNVKSAVIYIKKGNDFQILKSWDDIDISLRNEVKQREQIWKELLHQILIDLNNYFESNKLSENTLREILSFDDFIDVILENTLITANSIKSVIRSDSLKEADINQWWNASYGEYGSDINNINQKFETLSRVILTDWVFKILFSNILKIHFNEAKKIEKIKNNTSINDAISIIISISKKCNFWNILSPNLGQESIPEKAWSEIKELNIFLSEVNIQAIDIEMVQKLLKNSLTSAKRKIAGQFSTPQNLANLLARLTIIDKNKNVIDPCCGTGTIINEAYKIKEEYELNQEQILNTIWASDKQSFPIQMSTMIMSKPSNIGKIINVFKSDIMELNQGKKIEFRNPNNGKLVYKNLPKFDYVISNLPFIKNKEMKVLNPETPNINDWIKSKTKVDESLSGKSDFFVYLPFYIYNFLSNDGKIGLILSNAWLGSEYGRLFLNKLHFFYKIEYVLISGKGKWFKNTDVVTTIIIASKKEVKEEINSNHKVSFCTLKKKINKIENVKSLSENIILNNNDENISIRKYSLKRIKELEDFGLPWSAYFSNLSWVNEVKQKLINANKIFRFIRGERRGWNPLFYPQQGHTIEKEYIQPVLKHLRDTKKLECKPNKDAFCCSKSISELKSLGHNGTLNWINSFKNQRNGTNIPLPEVLAKPNMYWYEMKTNNMVEFVANINFANSLYIAKFEKKSFIDQRMIGLSIKTKFKNENQIIYLALFNSIISMFLIESLGFGRGLGALDLRAKLVKKNFKILNPNNLSNNQKKEIIDTFIPIMNRDRMPLLQEIESNDRIRFEKKLMKIYKISKFYNPIKESLKELYNIRIAVEH